MPRRTHPFSFDLGGSTIHWGRGESARLGSLCAELGMRRVLLVSDAGLLAAGHVEHAVALLRLAGLGVEVFTEIAPNPTTDDVDRGVEVARRQRTDGLVALGGGSAMDACKGINFLLTQGGRMEDFWGDGLATQPMLPSVGVPTTAGTGSEAQRFALIAQAASHQKMACGDRKARFRAVVLDAELLATLPRPVAGAAAFDALSHAVESFVTRDRHPVSQMLAKQAFELLDGHFERHLANAGDLEAAGQMLLGAHLAGGAIETSMLGIAHSCANPLTARHGVIHGAAVALCLPTVVRFNAEGENGVAALYRELAPAGDLAERLDECRALAGLPDSLREVGVAEAQLPTLAEEAAGQWTARFNPRTVAANDLLGIYQTIY